MRISFDAESAPSEDDDSSEQERFGIDTQGNPLVAHLIKFSMQHRGSCLLKEIVEKYLRDWWGFEVSLGNNIGGDIIIADEDASILQQMQRQRDFSRPVVILSSVRGDATLMAMLENFERSGGFCR